jgi:hypothetical protein
MRFSIEQHNCERDVDAAIWGSGILFKSLTPGTKFYFQHAPEFVHVKTKSGYKDATGHSWKTGARTAVIPIA